MLSSVLSQDSALQEVSQAPDAQADQQRKSRKVWGGVEGGAVLPTEQELKDFAKREGIQRRAVSEWINQQNIFPSRLKPNSGYTWILKHKGLTRSLNACHLTFGLAYLHAKGLDFTYDDLPADFLRLHQHQLAEDLVDTNNLETYTRQCKAAFAHDVRERVERHKLLTFLSDLRRQPVSMASLGHGTSSAVDANLLEALRKKRARTAAPKRLREPSAELIAEIADMGAEETEGVDAGRRDREAPGAGHSAGQADAALLLSLAQEPPECAGASPGNASQGAILQALLQQVKALQKALQSGMITLQEGVSATSRQIQQVAQQQQQIHAMLLALLQSQQGGGVQQVQRPGAVHQHPLHAGMALPRTKAERARRRQQLRWEAQRQAQRVAAMTAQHASSVASAAPQRPPAASAAPAPEPAAAPQAPDLAQQPWQEWQGAIKTITKGTLTELFEDGVSGILMNRDTGQRILPLMELEEKLRGVGGRSKLRWRGGNKIAKDVSDRKMLLYAIFRRMDDKESSVAKGSGWRGFASAAMREKLGEAVRALEGRAASLCRGNSKPSLDKLCTKLRQPQSGEYVPTEYEVTMLGWPSIASFPKGNPRKRVSESPSLPSNGG